MLVSQNEDFAYLPYYINYNNPFQTRQMSTQSEGLHKAFNKMCWHYFIAV